MGVVPSREGGRDEGVKNTQFPFKLIKTSTKGNLAILGEL